MLSLDCGMCTGPCSPYSVTAEGELLGVRTDNAFLLQESCPQLDNALREIKRIKSTFTPHYLKGQVVKMARTCDPTVEDKLRIRGVSMIRLGQHDYQTAQDLAKQVCLLAATLSHCYGNI